MEAKNEIKDIGLKIGTKKQVKLEELKNLCEEELLNNEIDSLVRKAIIQKATEEIEKEKKTLNS